MSYLQAAFEAVCKDAKPAKGYYVTLMESVPYYGGPEEGGWWGSDTHIVAYKWYDTEEEAEAAREMVKQLAEELQTESRKAFGEQCLRECDWCERHGYDADYLPEPDGESTFYVEMSEGLPTEHQGCRHYE